MKKIALGILCITSFAFAQTNITSLEIKKALRDIIIIQDNLKEENEILLKKIEKLKKEMKLLKIEKEVKIIAEIRKDTTSSIVATSDTKPFNNKTPTKKIRIVNRLAGVDSYTTPYNDSKIIQTYPFNHSFEVEYCNRRGWCKLAEKDEYVKNYLLRK